MVQEDPGTEGGGCSRSIGQLKTYTRCSESYYLERVRRSSVPSRPAPWTMLGIAFHDTIRDWEASGRDIDPLETFSSYYDSLVKEAKESQPNLDLWMIPPGTKWTLAAIKNYRDRGLKYLPDYIESCLSASWEILKIEEQFEIEVGGILVKGAVDRILYFPAEDTYVIEDLKTGSIEGEDDIRQLGWYAFAARELWNIPVYEGRYWFARLNRGSQFVDLRRFDREYWERTFTTLDFAINEGIFLPSPGKQCGICSVIPYCSLMGTESLGVK